MCIHEVMQLCTVRVQPCDSHHAFVGRPGKDTAAGWAGFGNLRVLLNNPNFGKP